MPRIRDRNRERERERERRRRGRSRGEGRGRRRRLRRDNNNQNDDYYENYYDDYDDGKYDDESDLMEPSLEDLLSTPKITDANVNVEDDKDKENNLTRTEFKKKHINKLYEDMLYYFSSPEILKNYKSNIEEEKNYDFYKDIDSENFIIEQKERVKTILGLPKINLDSVIKSRKLVNYENIFQPILLENEEENKKKYINANLLRKKMKEYFDLCLNENDEIKILSYLNELKEEFKKNLLDIEILGLVFFNYIEDYLVQILTLIAKKLDQNKNKKNINDFIMICSNILKYFKSSQLIFFIIKYSKQYLEILEILESKDDLVQFIPNKMINFEEIEENENLKYICNLNDILTNKDTNINYWTLIYDNYLLVFFDMGNYFKDSEDIYFNYIKIHLIDKKIVYKGKIDIDKKSNIKLIDLNISIKNDIIYFL